MTTARLSALWARVERAYECSSNNISRLASSKTFARIKEFANIALTSNMAVQFVANFCKNSDSDTEISRHPSEYLVTAVIFGFWSAWEYQKNSLLHHQVDILNEAEGFISEVDNNYKKISAFLKYEDQTLKATFGEKGKEIPQILDNVILPKVSRFQSIFDSKLGVYIRAMVNGGVIGTTVYQLTQPGWFRDLSLRVGLMGGSLWFNDSICESIARNKKFAEIKAFFPMVRQKLNFLETFSQYNEELENTALQINTATEGRISIKLSESLAPEVQIPSAYVKAGNTIIARGLRAFARGASQAESIRVLTQLMIPVISPSSKKLVAGIFLMAAAPRAFFKEKAAHSLHAELESFQQEMFGISNKVRYVDSILTTADIVLKTPDQPESISPTFPIDVKDNSATENDLLLAASLDNIDLESGQVVISPTLFRNDAHLDVTRCPSFTSPTLTL